MKLNTVTKICLAGLILALTVIFTRFLSIQNIPVLPFVRISIGPALIIFSSLLLGPLFGGVIGGASDILGILLVPNALGYSINPWFTLIYTLLGILPWCIYQLFKKIQNEKALCIIFGATLLALWSFVFVYGLLNNTVGSVTFELWQKIFIFSISFVLCTLTVVLIYVIRKHFFRSDEVNIWSVAFTCLISEIFVMLIGNTIVKSIFFEVDFLVILFFQAIVFFINIPLNTVVVGYLLKLSNKVFLNKNHI